METTNYQRQRSHLMHTRKTAFPDLEQQLIEDITKRREIDKVVVTGNYILNKAQELARDQSIHEFKSII